MKKILLSTAVTAMALQLSTQALAQDDYLEDKFYVRLSVGQTDYDSDGRALNESIRPYPLSEGANFNFDNPTGFSVSGGYQFSPFIAVELGYYELGDASASINRAEYFEDGEFARLRGDAKLAADSIGASFRLHTDKANPFYVGALVGYHSWDQDIDGDITSNTRENFPNGDIVEVDSELSVEGSLDGTDPFFGVFAVWNSPIGDIGLEYTAFEMDGERPSMVGLSYAYRF